MGLTKAAREERKAFVKSLLDEGHSGTYVMEQYDAKYGTHYSFAGRRALKGGN